MSLSWIGDHTNPHTNTSNFITTATTTTTTKDTHSIPLIVLDGI